MKIKLKYKFTQNKSLKNCQIQNKNYMKHLNLTKLRGEYDILDEIERK